MKYEKELSRLAVLRASGLLDTPPEAEFEALVDLARELTGCRNAAIALIDADRQWFKAERGIGAVEIPRERTFCSMAIEQDELLVVPDARIDPYFKTSPYVTGAPGVRFYAGMPLRLAARPGAPELPLGTFCVSDDAPRLPDAHLVETLRRLATVAEQLMRARLAVSKAAELMERHEADMVELTRAQRYLVQTERLADIGSWRFAFADQALEWSNGVFAIHGMPPGTPPSLAEALNYYPPQSRAIVVAAVERASTDFTPFDLQVDLQPAGGGTRRVRVLGDCELVDGKAVALTGVFQDVTDRYEAELALRRSASVDELTGLANRAAFNAELDARIARAQGRREPLALALIDLDGFKAVNDRHGHLAGDEVLQAVARRLDRPVRAGCCPARLGGDEFVLLLDEPAGSTAFHAAVETLLADLRVEVQHEGAALRVSGTVGISWFDGASSRRDMLNRADQALYAAKRRRRGTARVFGSDLVFGDDKDFVADDAGTKRA